MKFKGDSFDYRHFRTDRHSGLMPHHFERRRPVGMILLLAATIALGIGALAVFALQVLR